MLKCHPAQWRKHERRLRRVDRRIKLWRGFRNEGDLRLMKLVEIVDRRSVASSHKRSHREELEEVRPLDGTGNASVARPCDEGDDQRDPEDDSHQHRVDSCPAGGVRPQMEW